MKIFKNVAIIFLLTMVFVMVGSPLSGVLANPIPAVAAPNLGSAASFVALANSTVTNTGAGVFVGDVGVFPDSSVIGFPPGTFSRGSIHLGDPVASQAQMDALTAYNDLKGRTCNVDLTGKDLGGMTLTPDVYCLDTSAQLTGALDLDALGNPLAIWVFQTGSTLTTASNATVSVINGGQAINIYWQVGSSATLGTGTRFEGNILADASISMNTAASLLGRAIALNGAVTMNTTGTPFPVANTPMFNLLYFPKISK